jgi:hypothetical protein
MPNKIKSAKQFRFLEAVAGGMKLKGLGGKEHISSDTAKEMLSKESHETKSAFAKKRRK